MTPTVETERLVLRGHRLSDYDDVSRMWGDPVVTRYITGGRPFTREETWSRMLRNVGHWALLGFGLWIAHDKSGLFVGEFGLAVHQRAIEPPFGDAPEAGWVMAPWAHGRGLATEAMRAVVAWSDANLRRRTVCMIDPENAASIRVAEKCGYREYARAEYRDHITVLFERPAP